MKVFYTEDQKFEVRPWGGRMCFLATEDSAQSKLLGVTAVLRMGQGLTHSTHTHDDCDEIILVLNGEGSQLFQEEDGTEIRYAPVQRRSPPRARPISLCRQCSPTVSPVFP